MPVVAGLADRRASRPGLTQAAMSKKKQMFKECAEMSHSSLLQGANPPVIGTSGMRIPPHGFPTHPSVVQQLVLARWVPQLQWDVESLGVPCIFWISSIDLH